MKVLWFSNTASLGEHILNNRATSGGWIIALDTYIQKHVELHIAFHYHKEHPAFKYGNTHYHPIFAPLSKRRLILNKFWRYKIYDKEYLDKYISIINLIQPDLIHIHGTENSFSSILHHTNIPVVVSIQGIINAIYSKLNDITHSYSLDWKLRITQQRFKAMAFIERKYSNEIKYIISKSVWNSRISTLMAPNAKIWQINNILREQFYLNNWNNNNLDREMIVLTTTLSDGVLKGFDVITKIAELLHSYEIKFEWRIIGIDINSRVVSSAKRKVQNNLSKFNIKLIGRLNESELINALLDATFYITCSRMENSPNNLNEALMLGIPTIASYSGGTGTFINDTEDGILVQDGDVYGFAGAIVWLFNHPNIAIAMSKAARERALLRHKKENIGENVLNVYKSISIDTHDKVNKNLLG